MQGTRRFTPARFALSEGDNAYHNNSVILQFYRTFQIPPLAVIAKMERYIHDEPVTRP